MNKRFKYKEAVKKIYPTAVCKNGSRYQYNGKLIISGFVVTTEHERISNYKTTAELAWTDAYYDAILKAKQTV